MSINVVEKGKEGERQVMRALNVIIREEMHARGYPVPEGGHIQRNQNQSAVGGSDLSGTFGMSIEVKRQETLAVQQWWRQCVAQAERENGFPVLIYRQNRRPWRVVTYTQAPLLSREGPFAMAKVRTEMSWESFLGWFRLWVARRLDYDGPPDSV